MDWDDEISKFFNFHYKSYGNLVPKLPSEKFIVGNKHTGDLITKFFGMGEYESTKLVRPYPNSLYIHLEQLSKNNNLLNGQPSDLLDVISIRKEEKLSNNVMDNVFTRPNYKQLINEPINELTFNIKDENGKSY